MEAHTGDQGTLSLTGGQRLQGSVSVRGAKNSVLKLMAAALLASSVQWEMSGLGPNSIVKIWLDFWFEKQLEIPC